jgi:hypothetical protein
MDNSLISATLENSTQPERVFQAPKEPIFRVVAM